MTRVNLILLSIILPISQIGNTDEKVESYNFFEGLEDQSVYEPQNDELIQDVLREHTINKRYVGEDEIEETFSVISHNFYENDRFRFYNYTRYDISDLKNRYQTDGASEFSFSDISFSLGYGMEYKVSELIIIGYEYLSSFPSYNTQSIRLFAKTTF